MAFRISPRYPSWRAICALACVVLLAGFTTAAGVHSHTASSPEDPAHCQLCIAAHAPVAVATPVALVMQAVWTHISILPASPRPSRTSSFDLNIRPPPTLLS